MSPKTRSRVIDICSDLLPEAANLDDDTPLTDLGMDDLDSSEIVLEVEEEFDINLSESEVVPFTIRKLCELVERKLEN